MTLVERLLKEIEESGSFDDAWVRLYQGPLDVGDKVNEATYTVVPRVVAVAERQDPKTLSHFWWQIAIIATNFHHYPKVSVPADVEDAFRSALHRAEALTLRCFAAADGGEEASELALACVALTYHPVGCFIWQGPSPPREDDGDFVRFYCPKCGAEDIWFAHVGDGVAGVLDWENPPQAADDQQPSLEAPPVPDLSGCERPSHPWGAIAAALDQSPGRLRTLGSGTPFPKDFLGRFGAHLGVARAVAKAGVPKEAPNRAVLSLLGVMVALSGAFDWAGRLLRLAGFVRCPECGNVDTWANCLENIG